MDFFKKHKRPIWEEITLRLARLPWHPKFHKTVDNPHAPGGKVDMWLIVDEETGEGIVSIGCPVNRPDIPAYIADCCTNPWMTRPDKGDGFVGLAVLFNRAVVKHFKREGMADAQEVARAAMAVIDAYLRDVPARARVELINEISSQFMRMREGAHP